MDIPLISVIVPAYNAQRWIEDCCQSVFRQTYPNWELILVDDGSQDDTLLLASKMAFGRKNVIVIHTDNGGVSHARNMGLDIAKGRYLTFLDADDALDPGGLQCLYQLISESGADIAAGTMRAFTQRLPGDINDPFEERICWNGTEALKCSLEDHPAGYSACAKLYRKDVVRRIRFAEGKKIHEDSFFVFRCFMEQPRVVISRECVYYQRGHPDSASRADFSDTFFDILYFAQEKVSLVEKYHPELKYLTDNLLVKANMALLRNLCKTYDRKYRQAQKQCLRTVREKRGAFLPAVEADERWFRIIVNHVYGLYKFLYYIRRKRRMR